MLSEKEKISKKKWADKNREKVRDYSKKWRENNKKKAKEMYKYWYEKKGGREYKKKYSNKTRTKKLNSIRDKSKCISLKNKICEECGSKGNLQRHHFNYNNPLDIKILCIKCHKAWHKNNKPKTTLMLRCSMKYF